MIVKTIKDIKIGDSVTLLISEIPTIGIVEKICKAPVESLLTIRLTPTLYTTVNSKYIEYRNYDEKGFYRKVD